MHWKAAGLVECTLHFEGDVFETEDQRNWADSSYKTYSTPLALPFPAQVAKGDRLEQHVVLEVKKTEAKGLVFVNKDENNRKDAFPGIGYARFTGSAHLSDSEIQLLQQVPFDHYRVELYFKSNWKSELTNALSEGKRLGTKLELVLFFDDSVKQELAAFCDFIHTNITAIATVLPLWTTKKTTTPDLMQQVYGVLKKLDKSVKVGYGTNGFFADLNRNRPQTESCDFVSFSHTPQVHLTDTRTMIENVDAQRDTIKTIQTFSASKSIHVSPVTFSIRFANSNDEKLKCGFDSRQHTSFGAMWTLGCIANLSAAKRITFYQAAGPCGIANEVSNQQFSPLYEVLKQIKKFNPKWIYRNASDNSVCLENENGETLVYMFEPK